jgi:GT2 family glycosyltransferase
MLMIKMFDKKIFTGSKNPSFYGEGYYLRGEGSNYGRKDGGLSFAPYEEQYYLPRDRQYANFIVSTYKPSSVLVLGCARAYLVQALRELGVDAKGIDISEWAITNAPGKIKEHLFIGDICDLSLFKDNKFDCVIALDVFEHINTPDLYLALDEASRICRRLMVIDVPIAKDDLRPDQSSGSDKSHVSIFSEAFWLKQFSLRNFLLDGKDIYSNVEGKQGGTIIFKKMDKLPKYKDKWPNNLDNKLPVDIVMINFNGLKFTPKCIETLYKNTDYPFNLIVVDNHSTDGSAEYLTSVMKKYSNIKVVFSDQPNSGFAEGVNIGLKNSSSPYVLLLNNDTLFFQKNWLSILLEALNKDSNNGIVSPKLLYLDDRIQYAGASFNQDLQPYHIGRFKNSGCYDVEREIPWATFACALIRRELLGSGLDEAYKLGTFEDVDFCCNARIAAWKILYVPASVVYHYEGATISTLDKVRFSEQQKANVELFYGRWYNWLWLNRNAYPEIYSD